MNKLANYMDNSKTLLKKATSTIRNEMFLKLEVEELFTNNSVIPRGEVVRRYDPKIHEACKHPPMHVIYDSLDQGGIKNPDEIRKAIRETSAQAYILGDPLAFNVPDSGGDVLVLNFPIVFYKLRKGP